MDYLVNFLFSNLIPIIIVVSVVLRIYKGMKSAADSRRGKTAPIPVQEAEEQDGDGTEEEWGRDDTQPRFYLAESAPPRQTVQPPSLVPLPGLRPLEDPVTAAPHPGGTAAQPISRQAPVSPAAEAAPAFFRRIRALRPMQQALVLSEILGPPRGTVPPRA
jgi:hypothetical protein